MSHLFGTIRNYKIDNIDQLYTLKDTRMQNLNKVYFMVYELWRFFLSKTWLLEGPFFRNGKLEIFYFIIIMKKCFPIEHF
jgi:hypothetical protein